MNNQDAEIDLKNILKIISRYYWVFLLSGLLCFVIARLYLQYSPKKFDVGASILIKEEENSPISGSQEFIVRDLFGNSSNIYNEILVIQSNPILEKTIQNLDLEVTYYEKYNFTYQDIYKQSPFKITFYKDHPQLVNVMYYITFKPDGSYLLQVDKQEADLFDFIRDEVISETKVSELILQGSLGQLLETDQYKFIISLNEYINDIPSEDNKYAFKIIEHFSIEEYYNKHIVFTIADRNANVINMDMETSNVEKDAEVMNELISVYLESNLEQKNHIADLTVGYIERQLEEVAQALDITENALQNFLSQNKLIDVGLQADRYTDQLRELQNELATYMVQKRYFDYASNYLQEQSNDELIIAPSTMGVDDELLNRIIMELSSAQSRKANLIENNQERNPLVERLTIQIENLQAVVAESIRSAKQSNEISINELENRISGIEREISALPEAQRTLGNIERTYQLNDAIYTYLLQKRAEAKITMASNLPDMTIIQPAAMNSRSPVAPNVNIVYGLALLLGLGIPFTVLYIIDLIRRARIKTPEELQKLTTYKVLGTVLHLPSKYRNKNVFMPSAQRDMSNYAEAYRTIYTNLNFLFKDKKKKTILVTSSVAEEGKTFNSLNVAAAFASMKNVTVLVNCDLHKRSKFMENVYTDEGLSHYLSGNISIDQLILPSELDNLFYIPSGNIAPNPVELLSSNHMDELMTYLKEHFDCIILDSSPLAHVSDAYYLTQYADINLIVTRYQMTRKRILLKVLNDLKSKDIHNIGLILNDNRSLNEQLGYGYGYYGKTKKNKSKLRQYLTSNS